MANKTVNNKRGYVRSTTDEERKAAGTRAQLEAREKSGTISVQGAIVLEELRREAEAAKKKAAKKKGTVKEIIRGIGSGIMKSLKKRTGSESMAEKHDREHRRTSD
jgi:hypothetical protein